MDHASARQKELLQRYLDGTASIEETEELFDLLQVHPQPRLVISQMTREYASVKQSGQTIQKETTRRMHQKLMQAIAPPVNIRRLPYRFLKYAAVILLLLTAIGFYLQKSGNPPDTIGQIQHTPDISAGSSKAVLTLSNGRQIELNSKTAETIPDSAIVIGNRNGELMYHQSGTTAYNTMSTPRGGQYRLRLPDGTKVWLNAASSIVYPTSFNGSERKVEITGEAYFEVAKNSRQPFKVTIDKTTEIEVLGTYFNVNAYTNEPTVTATLLQGSVKINKEILQPGQAWVNGKIETADTGQAIAWKNGVFNFKHADLPLVMRQFERWYDITVLYEGAVPAYDFQGKLTRDLSLFQVTGILEKMGVPLKLEGRKLTIRNKK